jgi:hypothetical protein
MTSAAPDREAVRNFTSPPRADGRVERLHGRARERGVVLIWAAATMILVAGVVVQGTRRLKAVDEMAGAEFSAEGQAKEVAEAGLVDAYAWFRRQQVQPVTTFAPRRDLAAVPAINETDDPAVGLIRTFEISPGLWGRYTVRRGVAPEAYVDGNVNGHFDMDEVFTDTDGDGKRGHGKHARDVTVQRGLAGVGTVWHLESQGQIFRRPRADLPLGTDANVQLAEATLAAEVRRLGMVPPASAAICSSTSAGVSLGNRARVRSAGTCVAYGVLNSLPLLSGSELLGALGSTLVPGWNDSVDAVFGVDWTVLKGMADISTTDPVLGVPSPLPDATLVVVTGNVTFDAERPLKGTAVLVVKGNVTISAGSNSFFSGLLYVDGNLTVRAPALLRGTVIVRGTTDMRGTGGDYVEVERDSGILTRLMTLMGQYRYSKAAYQPSLLKADGRPDESKGRKIKLKPERSERNDT